MPLLWHQACTMKWISRFPCSSDLSLSLLEFIAYKGIFIDHNGKEVCVRGTNICLHLLDQGAVAVVLLAALEAMATKGVQPTI